MVILLLSTESKWYCQWVSWSSSIWMKYPHKVSSKENFQLGSRNVESCSSLSILNSGRSFFSAFCGFSWIVSDPEIWLQNFHRYKNNILNSGTVPLKYVGTNTYLLHFGIREQKQIVLIKNYFTVFQNMICANLYTIACVRTNFLSTLPLWLRYL